jgi:drug/metabolite transporter (DMT)-like permease
MLPAGVVPSASRWHLRELALAWIVTIIWASSFPLMKIGLAQLQPLDFAAMRYSLGGVLLAAYLSVGRRERLQPLQLPAVGLVLLAGVLAYTVGQGLFYVGQVQVSALTGAFFYSLAPVFVLLLSVLHGRGLPDASQLLGVAAVTLGGIIFYPPSVASDERGGAVALLLSNVATAYYLLLVRHLRTATEISSGWLTALALTGGGGLLFGPAFLIEREVSVYLGALPLIFWLAVVNTALAYNIWNHVLRELTAIQLSVMGSLIPLQTAAISWLVLGSRASRMQVLGLLVVLAGVILVQLRPAPANTGTDQATEPR